MSKSVVTPKSVPRLVKQSSFVVVSSVSEAVKPQSLEQSVKAMVAILIQQRQDRIRRERLMVIGM